MTVLSNYGSKPRGQRRILGVLFFVILAAFIIGAYATAKNQTFTQHYIMEDISGLVYAFQSLVYGDVGGFVDGIFLGLPIIGLFLVMFTILYFLFSVTLAKLFHHRRGVSVTLSLVLTVYAFVNNTIYNYMLSLNAFAVGFIVFCAALIMIWGFTERSLRSYQREVRHLQELIEQKKAAGKDTREEYRKLRRAYQEMKRANYRTRQKELERFEKERRGDYSQPRVGRYGDEPQFRPYTRR